MHDGFGLNSGVTISNGNGALLVSGEAFAWRPWEVLGHKNLLNKKGQFELPAEAFGAFDVLWPRPGASPFADIPRFSQMWQADTSYRHVDYRYGKEHCSTESIYEAGGRQAGHAG